MKINVLELDQTLGEAPRHSLSKTKADLLVKGLRWAVRISRDTIQLVVAHSWSVIKAALRPILPKAPHPVSRYIPHDLAWSELPDLNFKVRLSDAGRELTRFTARTLRNRRSRKSAGIIYFQRLGREEFMQNNPAPQRWLAGI